MIRNKLILRNLIACILIDLLASFDTYLIMYYMKYVGGNVFLNNIYLCLGCNIAIMSAGVI